jgi:hypothetical protein
MRRRGPKNNTVTRPIGIRLTIPILDALDHLSDETGVSRARMIQVLVEQWLASQEAPAATE